MSDVTAEMIWVAVRASDTLTKIIEQLDARIEELREAVSQDSLLIADEAINTKTCGE